MLALVTGASGFVGSHLVEALAGSGWQVRRLARPGSRPPEVATPFARRVETWTAPLDDPGALAASPALGDVDVVFHVGGVTRARTARAFAAGNVRPTVALLDALAAQRRPPRRVVLVSSQAAVGAAAAPERPVRDGDAPRPVGGYGRSKRLAEEALAAHPARIPWTVVRPSAVYGPRDRDFLPVFRHAARGLALYPGTRDAWLSLVYVGDLARALVCAGTAPAAAGRTYLVAAEERVPWPAVYAAAAAAAGTRLRVELDVPRWALLAAGVCGDAYMALTGRAALVGREKVALGRPRWWLCTAARARLELGWRPDVPLAEGARRTWVWYRAAGWA